ncbi:spore photoproduct lyase family protein [uncultured Jannaschia sp.]|uniref:spore photoproduct lyase family protein n=1 Tax=uncultured Jannaschia sp. TaxID=293347 RepID=UPI00260EFADF|nr:radical SAM protein [uncultured Jannaschia sp.]
MTDAPQMTDAPHIAPTRTEAPREDPDTLARRLPHGQAAHRPFRPRRVLLTRAARDWPMAARVAERAAAMGAEIVELTGDRITGLKDDDLRAEYRRAKSTLAVTVASDSAMRPEPIPPSADWRFDLATGCPAHCQYCYLAGSLKGPPVTRLFANLPEILDRLPPLEGQGKITSVNAARMAEGTTFEASCYTDPLALEPLSDCLSETISWFGARNADLSLRFTTKFADTATLEAAHHNGRTRARFSVNAEDIARRFEGGTAPLQARLDAMGRLARAGYKVGLTVAPIMPIAEWEAAYDALFAAAARALPPGADITAELITHRFTPGSREVLLGWYPATDLEMDEAVRTVKRNKFGGRKYVYPAPLMREMRDVLEGQVGRHLPNAQLLYWT